MGIDSHDRILANGVGYGGWLLRASADGTVDSGFGTAGFADSLGETALQIDAQDRVLLVGHDYLLRHRSSDGQLDALGGSNSVLLDPPGNTGWVALQGDGRIVVVTASMAGVVTARRFSDGGILDQGFGGGLPILYPRTALSDVGNGVTFAGDDRSIRLTDAGTEAMSYVMPSTARATASAYFDGGLAVGALGTRGLVAKFRADGSLDLSFGDRGQLAVDALSWIAGVVADDEGHLLIAGTTSDSGGRWAVLRVDASGLLDTTFGDAGTLAIDVGGNAWLAGIGLQSDGRLVLAGSRDTSVILARLDL